jgi:molecular chaperone GrpE
MADDKDTRAAGDSARSAGSDGADQEAVTASGADAQAPEETLADDSPEALTARLGEALQQAETYRDQALRAQAEAENTRRRASRDVENAHKYALEKFGADLLPVLDSLEKAVEVASASEGAASIGEGVQLSLKLFLTVLGKHGMERVDPHGEPFDPQRHEALAMVPSAHAEPNSVIEVMQPGYLLNGRLVRAAKVIVSKAPAAEQ